MLVKFFSQDAIKYGLNEAIVLEKLRDLTALNKDNSYFDKEGRVWVKVSVKALSLTHIDFLTEKQIRTSLDNLFNKGAVLKANFNESPTDVTKWYSVIDNLVFQKF